MAEDVPVKSLQLYLVDNHPRTMDVCKWLISMVRSL